MRRFLPGFFLGFLLAAVGGGFLLWRTAREEGTRFPPGWIVNSLPERLRERLPGTSLPPADSAPGAPKSFLLAGTARALPVTLVDAAEPEAPEDDVVLSAPGTDAVAWIAAHSGPDEAPRMPRLELRAPAIPEGHRVRARLEVVYRRPYVGTRPDDRVTVPSGGGFRDLGPGEIWALWQDYAGLPFFGGDATLHFQLVPPEGGSGPAGSIRFRIAGENPQDDLCKAYILAYAAQFAQRLNTSGELAAYGVLDLPVMWFAYAIAKSESSCYNGSERYNQFWARNGSSSPCNSGVTYPFRAGDPLVIRTKGEQSAGGNGMFQVTGNAQDHTVVIPREPLWNWQANVHAAFDIFRVKQIGAHRAMATRRRTAAAASTPVPLPTHQVRAATFADGTPRTMEDALTIKRYNGMSKKPGAADPPVPGFYTGPPLVGDYCYWHDSRRVWALAQRNNWGFNYVNRVCSEMDD